MYKVETYLRVRRDCFVEGMSVREAARVFGLHRDKVRKMPMYSVPPWYRREQLPHESISTHIFIDESGKVRKGSKY